MKFSLTIKCDNAAFGDSSSEKSWEVARILGEVAKKLEHGEDTGGYCIDMNGNKVGTFCFADE